jgi:hypothetical protein
MLAPIGMLVLLVLDPMGGSHLVSALEFIAALPDTCTDFHYHAANHSFVTALDGTVIFDPDPSACGYGIISSLSSHEVFDAGLATDSDFDGLPDIDENALGLDPNDPDSDDDGTLDGDEDSDIGGPDGLSNKRELYEFQPIPPTATPTTTASSTARTWPSGGTTAPSPSRPPTSAPSGTPASASTT